MGAGVQNVSTEGCAPDHAKFQLVCAVQEGAVQGLTAFTGKLRAFLTCPIHPSAFFVYSPRKDQHLLSPVNCWYLVLTQTRRESRDHATLNDIFTNNVIVRLSQISEDVIRLFKKVTLLCGELCAVGICP